MNGFFKIPFPANEPVNEYAPGSKERAALKSALSSARSRVEDIPMYINGAEIRTENTFDIYPPHDRSHKIGFFHRGQKQHVEQAIEAALQAKESWENMPWEQRAAIFLKAAELLAGNQCSHHAGAI